jgi:hypothetical protein
VLSRRLFAQHVVAEIDHIGFVAVASAHAAAPFS